jgi:hypothetical protein
MHVEISLLKEAEKVERTKKSIELGERTMVRAPIGGDDDGVFLCRKEEMPIGFSCIENEMQKCFLVYINRSHLPRERRKVASGMVSGKWLRRVFCNLVELGANIIHLNMMRLKVATRHVILVYETLSDRTKAFAMR